MSAPKSAEAIAALAALQAHARAPRGRLPPTPPYERIPGHPYHLEQAIHEAWEAKNAVLQAEWNRVWATECRHEKVAAEEAAERKRIADEEASILAEAKRRLD